MDDIREYIEIPIRKGKNARWHFRDERRLTRVLSEYISLIYSLNVLELIKSYTLSYN